MHRMLFQLAKKLNCFSHPGQRMVLVRRWFAGRDQQTRLACKVFVPESPPKSRIPGCAGIDLSRAQDEGTESIGVNAGLIHTYTRTPRRKRTKPYGMEAEIRNLFGNQSIFAGMVGADLVKSTGRTGEIRLNHPMAWPIGSGFIVIDMADRQVDHRSPNTDCEVHRPCVVGEEQLTAREQADKLME